MSSIYSLFRSKNHLILEQQKQITYSINQRFGGLVT